MVHRYACYATRTGGPIHARGNRALHALRRDARTQICRSTLQTCRYTVQHCPGALRGTAVDTHLSYSDEDMRLAQFERKDAVPEVMPVDDDFATPQPAHEVHKRESRNAWRILSSRT